MTSDEQKPTIDQRLDRLVERHEALAQSIELLTHDIDQMRQEAREAAARERKGRVAILTGIAAYLRALNGEDGDEPPQA